MTDPKTAKLINQGNSQLVALPDDVRLPGDEVEVSQTGDTVTLRPIQKRKPMTRQEFDAWMAEIDKHAQGRFMEEGRQQSPMPPPDPLDSFD
ncbi:MAG: AbrB/MazE/SpoVT family DNA-binding domain-containing protein [Proteobacteria bacterium]|nr:AbrB/MazE/SpoVT family DNA-binding domain-containing protein [Pseudomonadota bacterium]